MPGSVWGCGTHLMFYLSDVTAALIRRDMELDCTTLTLRQNVGESFYSGPGYIRQDKSGRLNFTLYVLEARNHVPFGRRGSVPSPGQLVPPEAFFDLSAMDIYHREWTSCRILPDFVESSDGLQIVRGQVDHLDHQEPDWKEDAGHTLAIHFFRELEFPCNAYTNSEDTFGERGKTRRLRLNLAQFEAEGRKISVEATDGTTICNIRSQYPFPPRYEWRIVEAMEFVLVTSLRWDVLVHIGEGRTSYQAVAPGDFGDEGRARLQGPIPAHIPHSKAFWGIFERYLAFVVSQPNEGRHPCTRRVASARAASENTIEAWALGLGVAVEGLVNDLYDSQKFHAQSLTYGAAQMDRTAPGSRQTARQAAIAASSSAS